VIDLLLRSERLYSPGTERLLEGSKGKATDKDRRHVTFIPRKCGYVCTRKGIERNIGENHIGKYSFNIFSAFLSLQRRRNGCIYCVNVFDFVIVGIKEPTRFVCVVKCSKM
jgi:hypothetical protein